jgi:hypothetical protein
MASATLAIQFYLSAAWVDVSADVLNAPYIKWKSGFSRDEPTAVVADTGQLELFLDNSASNSGAAAGYYSPGHASARTGFELGMRVRVKSTYSAADRYQFHGRVSEISPVAGRYGKRQTRVIVTDYIEEMSARFVDLLTLQSSKTSDQLLTTLIATMDLAPLATSYDIGPDTFASAFHDVQGERMTVASIAQKIGQSDLSKIWVTGDATGGETLKLINRQNDIGKTSSLTLNDTMNGLDVERTRGDIYNKIVVSYYPIDEGATDEVLYSLPEELTITPGKTVSITALFRDPDGGERINGKNMVTPVADTDYMFSSISGSGSDLNASLGLSISFGSDRAELAFTNNHGSSAGFLHLFQLRGRALRLRNAVEVSASDSASISAYGEKRLEFRTPYQNNYNATSSFADFLKNRWANPAYQISRVSYVGNRSTTLMSAAVNRDLGDMITITETQTGINTSYIIIGREVRVQSGIWNVSYTVTPVNAGDYWLLGTAGSSELGVATILGF